MCAIKPRPLGVTRFGRGLVLAAGVLLLSGLVTACSDHKMPPDNQ